MSARIRTGFSFRHAAGKLEHVAARLEELDYLEGPITDTASTFGWVAWGKVCQQHGLRPVYGVELGVSADPTAKKPIVDYWTFISRDTVLPLHRLIGVATEQFRYEPLLTLDQAVCSASDVNVIMGHRAPVVSVAPRPGLFFGLGPGVNRAQYEGAVGKHHLVAVSNNRFVTDNDRHLYELACGKRASTQSYPQYILSDQEWSDYVEVGEQIRRRALRNRSDILNQSTATLPRGNMLHPERPKSLWDMCRDGFRRLGIEFNKAYSDRLHRELELIEAKGFEDYFYLVNDLVAWGRDHMLVGPARGSSCGSLVCYLLGITTVDPIPHGLLFERFIDINRPDLPDIDIDFSKQHRELVFEYLRSKYGPHRVARVGTVNMFEPRSALREIAFALDIPPWATDSVADSAERIKKLDPKKSALAEALPGTALARMDPGVLMAIELEDHPRHAGQHASGIVITAGHVEEVVAVDRRTGATMCDKEDAEQLGLLKVDCLGLTQLSIFEDALQLAGKPRDTLSKVLFNDPKAFHVLNSRRFAGIFQFNGGALQQVTKQVTVTSLEDMVALTSLARPGAIDDAPQWIKVKTGAGKVRSVHPLFDPILAPTFGVVIYQEQIMQICRAVGMTWEEVSAVRRLISKSAGVEALDGYKFSFEEGGKLHGVGSHILQELWAVLRASGAYSFNKSHAVAYSIISYWCCWLKAHYPLPFAAASLTHASEETSLKLLRELDAEGVRYVPAHPKLSTDKWSVHDGRLIGPLSNIIGIGPKHMSTILSQRARPHERLPDAVGKLLASPRTKVDDLWPVKNTISRLMTDALKEQLITKPTSVIDVQANGQPQKVLVLGHIDSIKKVNENAKDRVARRGGRTLPEGATSLNLQLEDDTDKILARIDWRDNELSGEFLTFGKGYYAILGTVPADFRMIRVEKFRFIGGASAENN